VAGLVEELERAHAFSSAAAAAQRLADAPGRSRGAALFPLASVGPLAPFASAVAGPLSAGAGRLVPITTALVQRLPLTSAGVTDLAFMPRFYDVAGVTGTDRSCPRWSAARDALLAGDPAPARRLRSAACDSVDVDLLGAVGDLEAGDRTAARARLAGGFAGASLADAQDARQNLWRWAGDLGRAERAAREWVAARGGAQALLRLGEIEDLRGHHDAAAEDFAASARRVRDRARTWSAPEANALLHRGAALQAAGRLSDAAAAFAQADEVASRTPDGDVRDTYDDPDWISYHARAELGDLERERGRPLDAAEQYAAARERGPVFVDAYRAAVERVDNNEAIVDLRLERVAAAVERSARAVAADPFSPVFLMLNGSAQAHAGHTRAAIQAYHAALAADPTAFPAANDLGVLLFRAGDDEGATRALRRAVGAAPRYALGWFNLGAVLAHRGPLHLIASQGALARAIALDDHYRGRRPEPQLDEQVYRSGLDLSRPLPPDWTFAGAATHKPAALVGGAALLLLALTLGRSLAGGADRRGTAAEWLGRIVGLAPRLPAVRMLPAVVGLAVAVAILARTLVPESGGGATAVVALVALCGVLLGLLAGARRLAARRAGRALHESTWPPGLVFGIGAGVFGLAWLPLPVVRRPPPPEEGEEPPPDLRLHRAAPAAAGLLAAVLLVLSVWLDVPLTRAGAIAALVAAASLLTPVRPLDGDVLSRASAAGAGLAAVGLGALTLLGLS
jgi:tetratricopeptide (TPR) repeat protein